MLEIINEEILPNALMIGVDYDLFWTLNPKSLKPFVKAFELRADYDDKVSWQNGMYVRLAIASVMDKNFDYPKKPLSANPKVKIIPKTPEEMQLEIKEKMFRQMKLLNSRFGEEVTN